MGGQQKYHPSPKKQQRTNDSSMEKATKPNGFLEPQGLIYSWIEEHYIVKQNESEKDKSKKPFTLAVAKDVAMERLVYLVAKEEGKETGYGYLAQICHKGSKVRLHYADASYLAGNERDEIFWSDLDPDDEVWLVNSSLLNRDSRPEVEGTPDVGGQAEWSVDVTKEQFEEKPIEDYLRECDTLKRKQAAQPTQVQNRKSMLTKAIARIGELEKNTITISEIDDLVDATMREMEQQDGLGSAKKNKEIVQHYLDGKVQVEAEHSLTDVAKELRELKAGMERIEKNMSKQAQMANVRAKAGASKGRAGGEDQGKVELVTGPGQKTNLYHFLAMTEQLIMGVEVGDLKFIAEKVEDAKAQIIASVYAFDDHLRDKGKGQSEIDTEMRKKLGEGAGEFISRVTTEEWNGKEQGAGNVETGLFNWRNPSKVAVVVVHANEIREGMSEEATLKHVYDGTWDGENMEMASQIVIGVFNAGQFCLAEVGGQAIFEQGEEHQRAIKACVEEIKKQSKSVAWQEKVQKVKDASRRLEMIKEGMRQAPGQLKSSKSSKRRDRKKKAEADREKEPEAWQALASKNGWALAKGANSNTADAGAWKVVARKNGWAKAQTQQANSKGDGGGRRSVSSVVVYTPVPADNFLQEVRRKDSNVRGLIQATRQKEGHIVLMATQADSEQLKQCVKAFTGWGFQAKPYYLKPGLAQAANAGVQSAMQRQALCRNYMNNQPCQYGSNCRFTCYHSRGQQG